MNSSELDKTITLLRNNPESICLQYLILSDDERKTEWTTYSHALAGVDTFFCNNRSTNWLVRCSTSFFLTRNYSKMENKIH